jgi:ankyrin repeat protein
VSRKNNRGQSAILYLSEKSTKEIVRRLADAGADINERDEEGNTPLMLTALLSKKNVPARIPLAISIA